jgi:hypothetical protein
MAEDGRVALAGASPVGADSSFEIDLEDRLAPGRYTLSAAIAVNGNVMNADIHRVEIVIPPGR